MKIQLSEHFTYSKLFRFVGPSVIMMVLTSIFTTIDDGLFVSNFVGKDAFVALNIMTPILTVISAIGFMLGAGGSALVSKLLGEKKEQHAVICFSITVYFTVISAVIMSVAAFLLLKPYCALMGAEGKVYENCVKYASVGLPCAVAFMLQSIFQTFLITAEKPTFAMVLTIISGACNIFFDVLLMVVLDLGIVGAACATVSGPVVTSIIPLFYFVFSKKSTLRLVKTRIKLSEIGRVCWLGVSQLISNLSMGLVSMVFNYQLMTFEGNNGVAAYGVIMYLSFIFVAVFLGYSTGVAPVIGYHYGANHTDELKSLYKKSMVVTAILSLVMTVAAYFTAAPFTSIFTKEHAELFNMAVEAYRIYGISFLFAGFGIFVGSFFTALNDGFTAGAISFARTIIFQIGTVLLMPLFWGIYGVWYAPVVAEILATAVALLFCFVKRKKYRYM